MKNWYVREAQVQSPMSDPNEYQTKVDVNIYPSGISEKYDVEGPDDIFMGFHIEIEARSWGIKDINVWVRGTIKIPISINDIETMRLIEEKEIIVDLDKIKKEETTGQGIVTVRSIDVYLDANFNVDYNHSSLEIVK